VVIDVAIFKNERKHMPVRRERTEDYRALGRKVSKSYTTQHPILTIIFLVSRKL
jgi:hypothetical protein